MSSGELWALNRDSGLAEARFAESVRDFFVQRDESLGEELVGALVLAAQELIAAHNAVVAAEEDGS